METEFNELKAGTVQIDGVDWVAEVTGEYIWTTDAWGENDPSDTELCDTYIDEIAVNLYEDGVNMDDKIFTREEFIKIFGIEKLWSFERKIFNDY
jgi:Ser-tRNA(Ala) deacylase AlaX